MKKYSLILYILKRFFQDWYKCLMEFISETILVWSFLCSFVGRFQIMTSISLVLFRFFFYFASVFVSCVFFSKEFVYLSQLSNLLNYFEHNCLQNISLITIGCRICSYVPTFISNVGNWLPMFPSFLLPFFTSFLSTFLSF